MDSYIFYEIINLSTCDTKLESDLSTYSAALGFVCVGHETLLLVDFSSSAFKSVFIRKVFENRKREASISQIIFSCLLLYIFKINWLLLDAVRASITRSERQDEY